MLEFRRRGVHRVVSTPLAEAVLSTARTAIRPLEGAGPLPVTLVEELASVGAAMRALDDVRGAVERVLARAASEPVEPADVVGALLRVTALDLEALIGGEPPLTNDR